MKAIEVASVVIGVGGLLSSLVAAFWAWRTRVQTLTIKFTDPEGRSQKLHTDHADLTYEQAVELIDDLVHSDTEAAGETSKRASAT